MPRSLDILIALIALTVLIPLLIIIPILITIDDHGPVFFSQVRLGKNKQPFKVWKFRTMKNQNITRVGKWLRPTAIDEFLQFLHILQGHMTLVGPRPLTKYDISRLAWNGPHHEKRWNTKPGITGIAQIYGGTSANHSWQLEQFYIKNKSFSLDIKIIILSALIPIFGKHRIKTAFPLKKSKIIDASAHQ